MEECSILGEYKTQQKQLENLNKNAEAYQLFSGSGECTYTWAGEGKSLFFLIAKQNENDSEPARMSNAEMVE